MTEKSEIIRELGNKEILLPAMVNKALLANDRIKYYFTLLQTAVDRAGNPGEEHPDLRIEREAADIDNPELDRIVAGTTKTEAGAYAMPLAGEILAAIGDCMQEMIRPFLLEGDDAGKRFTERLTELAPAIVPGPDGSVSPEAVARITSGDRDGQDSLHLLVMDVHRALNALQGEISREQIDGAATYLLKEKDRPLVRAFMAGINRTAPLKFDHPGLGTTATRSGDKILVQNDIGETAAHVIVITIASKTATVTYTDIHMPRLQFFKGLFEDHGVTWTDTLSRTMGAKKKGDIYHLTVGTYTARNAADLRQFLTFLGSRIVFLIDWNRARKRLRNFLPNSDAIAVLKWAADQEVGHIGFLLLGGERLIYDALELASRVPLRYGEPLHQILGREKTREYLQWVLRTATRGLMSNTSRFLLQDEIRAELLRYFRSTHEGVIGICEEHASYCIEVATVVLESLRHISTTGNDGRVTSNAKRAKTWERDADELVSRVRNLARRNSEVSFFTELINTTDDAIDYLEEASFYTTLVSHNPGSTLIYEELCEMASIALKSGREFLKALIAAQYIHRMNNREDMQEFLKGVDNVILLERSCDEALRKSEKTIFTQCGDFKELQLFLEIASNIEESTNSWMKAAFVLRDNMLEEVNR
jgi:uncharacterized protein Yka (UPF0111/DUF47 family)